MVDEPDDLDEHREKQVKKSIEIRRRLKEFQDDLVISKLRQHELEDLMLSSSAKTWPEVAVKALYLLQQYSSMSEAQDPKRQELIAHTILELNQLGNDPQVIS